MQFLVDLRHLTGLVFFKISLFCAIFDGSQTSHWPRVCKISLFCAIFDGSETSQWSRVCKISLFCAIFDGSETSHWPCVCKISLFCTIDFLKKGEVVFNAKN